MSNPDPSTDDAYSKWAGRTESAADVIAPAVIDRLWATLDRKDPPPGPGHPLPPLAHWLFFLAAAPQSQLGADGHERRGRFLPPIALPRRMWAGSRIEHHRAIKIGENAERRTTIRKVAPKAGRTGPLVFVTLHHEIMDSAGVAIEETQDIVYRGPVSASAPLLPPGPEEEPEFSREVTADAVMLFRYSALTFNGHKIHYDRDYATGKEGYAGLVVHGPLIAALLVDLLDRSLPGFRPSRIDVRAISPLFDRTPFHLHGLSSGPNQARLWACNPDGRLAMKVAVDAE
jgi:3-methylfumaryl-CoA hydratase